MINVNQVQSANDYAQKVYNVKMKARRIIRDHVVETKTPLLVNAFNRLVDGVGLSFPMIKLVLDIIQKSENPIPSPKIEKVVTMLLIDQPSFYNDFGQAFKD